MMYLFADVLRGTIKWVKKKNQHSIPADRKDKENK